MAQLVITDLSFFELELPKSGEISGGALLSPTIAALPQVAQYLSNYPNYLTYVGTVTPSPSPTSTYTTTIISFGTNKPPRLIYSSQSVTGGSSTNATSTGVDG